MASLISDKTSLLFYSKSGNGKSTQARYLAEYLWKKHKKKLRFIAADQRIAYGRQFKILLMMES